MNNFVSIPSHLINVLALILKQLIYRCKCQKTNISLALYMRKVELTKRTPYCTNRLIQLFLLSFVAVNMCTSYFCLYKIIFSLSNKSAFQWDAYRPLVDRIPACTVSAKGGGCLPGGCVSQHAMGSPPPVDRQTRVKA